jgi:uncharacterized membrane protein YheB (UPF0754 family)
MELVKDISVPFVTGIIGYVTNWTGVVMLFQPVQFKGFRVPGLKALAQYLPRKIQQVPGIMVGGIGWQGIIPSRAAKMGSIATDKGIAKVGSPAEFYERLEPERIAEHILETARGDIRDVVERTMEREHPQLWHDLPDRVREAIHERVQAQLPEIVHTVTSEIGRNINQLLDVKLMVIRHIEENPALANKIYKEVGDRELRLIINFGFLFGFILGIPLLFITILVPQWWVLPLGGVIIGWTTNWLALWMIFEPVDRRRIGPFTWHGLFLRRQDEVADVYAAVVSEDIITVRNIGDELLHGPSADRTRQMIETALRPAVDQAAGRARGAVRVAVGTREYDAIRDSLATEGVKYTMRPMTDPGFNERQSKRIHELIAERMREMDSKDFSEMLRSAMREDEWLLLAHGAVLGLAGGFFHLAVFGV